MPLPKLWYLEYISDRNAIYMIFEKLNNSKEHEICAKKPSLNLELGAVFEVRVHEEGKLKVSHAHTYRALTVANS